MTYSVQPTKPGGLPEAVSAAAPQNTARVIVRRKNITSARLLDEICRQSNFTWAILGRVIVVKPRALAPGTQP
jgi:type IV secretory pathway VirB9-like protein